MIFLFVLSCHSPKMKDTVPPFQDVLLSDDVILSEVQTCTNPSPNIHYQMYELPIVENSNINIHEHLDGGMIFVADFNQDGLLDIGNCFDLDSLYLYFGEEYSHDGISFSSYVHLSEDCSPSVVIDIDEDGDLDILRLSDKLQLFRNRLGESLATTDQMLFSKENVSLPLSMAQLHGVPRGLKTGDINGDGIMDFFVPKSHPERRPASEDFVIVSRSLEEYDIQKTTNSDMASRQAFDAVVWDNNQDGYDEVYVINDMGNFFGPNTMWNNVEGTLQPNNNDCNCEITMSGMGVDIGDINRDGYLDFLLTDTNTNRVLQGDTEHSWFDVTHAMGANVLEDWEMSWGGIFVDINNDGYLDILTAQGDLYYEGMIGSPYIGDMQLHVLQQKHDMEHSYFEEVRSDIGLDVAYGSFRNVLTYDINRDGIQDMIVTDIEKNPVVFLSEGCTAENWIEIEAPTGTWIEITTANGTYRSRVRNDSGFRASISPRLWFGLEDLDSIDSIAYQIPRQDWEEISGPIATRRKIQIVRSK